MKPAAPEQDIQVYANCMDKVRQRIGVVKWLVAGVRLTGLEHFMATELIFVQFRKVLELIAFSSLSANKDKYSTAHKNFGEHWKAVKMLDVLEKLNPNFYPVPLMSPREQPNGVKMFDRILNGFLTKEDFIKLYDLSSDVLHMRNPFSAKDPTIQIGYSVDEWVSRIQVLLSIHLVQLVDTEDVWVVAIPLEGPVQASKAKPNQPTIETEEAASV